MRREIQAHDPLAVVNQVTTMEDAVAESIAGPRFRMLLIGVFATVALMLAATGIYGVMAYSVAQRTHEMGLRLALGAARADVLRWCSVRRRGWRWWASCSGSVGALMLTRWMSTLLFGVEATDPDDVRGRRHRPGRHRAHRQRAARAPRHAHRSDRRAASGIGGRVRRAARRCRFADAPLAVGRKLKQGFVMARRICASADQWKSCDSIGGPSPPRA